MTELAAIKGIHHVSALTAKAPENFEFYTKTLGLRLIKKTVNQDDNSMYHLFYGDEKGNPGTELTFFEMPNAGQTRTGTNSISATSLRVPSDASLDYWKQRFEELNVDHDDIVERAGRKTLAFRDFEQQRLILVSDEHNEGVAGGVPWEKSVIPQEHAIVGLGPVQLTVEQGEHTAAVLIEVLASAIKAAILPRLRGSRILRCTRLVKGAAVLRFILKKERICLLNVQDVEVSTMWLCA